MSWSVLFFLLKCSVSAAEGVPNRAKVSEPKPDITGGVTMVIDHKWRCGFALLRQCVAHQYVNPDGTTTPALGLGGAGGARKADNPDGTPGAWINGYLFGGDLVTDDRYLITDDGWIGPFDAFVDFGWMEPFEIVDRSYFGAIKRGDKQAAFWGRWVSDWRDEVLPIDYGLLMVPYYAYREGSEWYIVYDPTDPDGSERYGPFEAIGNHRIFHVQGNKPAFQAFNGESWCGIWGDDRPPACGFDDAPSLSYGDGIIFEGQIDGQYTTVHLPEDSDEDIRVWVYPGGAGQRELVNTCSVFRAHLEPAEYADMCPDDVPEPDAFLVTPPDNP